MNEIIKLVAEKTGISESVAKMAVELVISQLKDKLPEGISGHIDSLLDGKNSGDVSNSLGDLTDMLGGFFGKK